MWRNIRLAFFVIVALFALLVVGLGFWSLRNLLGGTPYTIRTSSKTVIKELRELQRFETASFTIEKVIDAGTSGNRFQEILFGDRILLIAQGEVIAGFDFRNLKEDNMRISGTEINITLPPAQILVTDLDNKETRVYDRRLGLLTKGNADLESQARLAAEESIRGAACSGGILQQATDNAKKQLTTLFGVLGFTKITIEIPSSTC